MALYFGRETRKLGKEGVRRKWRSERVESRRKRRREKVL